MKKLFTFFLLLIEITSYAQPINPKHPKFCSINYDLMPLSRIQNIRVYWQAATDTTILGYKIKRYSKNNFISFISINSRDSEFVEFKHTWSLDDRYFSLFAIDKLGNEFSDSTLFTTIFYEGVTIMGSNYINFYPIDTNTRIYEYRYSSDSLNWSIIKTYTLSQGQTGLFSYKLYGNGTRPPGLYQVVTFNNVCKSNNASYRMEGSVNPNGLNENYSYSGISFYPNPTVGKVNFIIPETLKGKNIKVDLFNILGELIEEASISDIHTVHDFNSSIEHNGLYFFKFDNEPILRKIIFSP